RLDRRPREGLVGREQPAEGFLLVEAAVEQHRQRPAEALDDLPAVKEGRRDGTLPVRSDDGQELAVAKQLLHAAGGDIERDGCLREGQPLADERVRHGVYLVHETNFPRPGGPQTNDISAQYGIFTSKRPSGAAVSAPARRGPAAPPSRTASRRCCPSTRPRAPHRAGQGMRDRSPPRSRRPPRRPAGRRTPPGWTCST